MSIPVEYAVAMQPNTVFALAHSESGFSTQLIEYVIKKNFKSQSKFLVRPILRNRKTGAYVCLGKQILINHDIVTSNKFIVLGPFITSFIKRWWVGDCYSISDEC